jgi:diaminopimelate dehydrogenase
VIGLGRVGRLCAEAALRDEQVMLAGIVRRAASVGGKVPPNLAGVPIAGYIGELRDVHAALVCVPTAATAAVAGEVLQHGIAVVESAVLHGEAFQRHKAELNRVALHHRRPAILGAGWDPGALSLFRALFGLLAPKGQSEMSHRPGVHLHHSTLAGAVPGVRAALALDFPGGLQRGQHYIYVEAEAGADFEQIAATIRADPLLAGETVFVFPVESVADLEEQGHGVVVERRGAAVGTGHQQLLLEARFSEAAMTAQVMLAAARALPLCGPGAHSLLSIPAVALWGELRDWAEREWL